MASKVFLDANIILDLTLERANYDVAKKIFELAINRQILAFTSPSVLSVCGHWTAKLRGDKKAKEYFVTLLTDVTIIEIEHNIVLHALLSEIYDIEDSLQYFTALHHKIDYFITRDKQLLKHAIPELPIYSPEDFLREFNS